MVVDSNTCLKDLLSQCSDFLEEETMLQTFVKKLGARCVRSPKYHCEIAGEGIEYSWGNSKMKYRRTPYSQKRSTSDFILLVGKCLSREYLHRERVRKNSRRAREYMAAYFILSLEGVEMDKGDNSSDDNVFTIGELKPCAVSSARIEKMKQSFRTHRSAFDFDTAFCKVDIVHVKVEKAANEKRT